MLYVVIPTFSLTVPAVNFIAEDVHLIAIMLSYKNEKKKREKKIPK